MVAGEGLRVAAGVAGMVAIVAGLVIVGDWLERQWRELAASYLDESELSAAAIVPEYAAARRGCGCAACRNRPSEPCSDYDGD